MSYQSVAILPGWSEGAWHAKTFARTLKKRGYDLIGDSLLADVIVAHSGGCYMVPAENVAGRILLIGPPHWPGRSIYVSLAQKVRRDVGSVRQHRSSGYFVKKVGASTFYLAIKPVHWGKMHRNWRRLQLPKASQGQKILLLRNRHDTFCEQDGIISLCKDKGYGFLSLNGEHDDCWLRPEQYIDVLDSMTKRVSTK